MSIALFFQNINQIEIFKNYFNFQHANIKFNSEMEMNNLLLLLDHKIIKENKKNIYLNPNKAGLFEGSFS